MSIPVIHSQHKLSELISLLEVIKEHEGDLPVVYWDQNTTVTFNDFADQALFIEKGHLYFGGFHLEFSKCYNDDPVVGVNVGNVEFNTD